MSGFFYNLGKTVGPQVRKARWVWLSMTGDEADAIKVEYEVGIDLAREVRRQLEADEQPEAVKLLRETGARLSACVVNKLRKFNFEIVQSVEPNAFALPGGFIFITRPLLELCERQRDEIAFVLGHEMGHIMRGHAIERIINRSAINIATAAAPIQGLFSGWLRKAGVKVLESAYSQGQELEADGVGVRLLDAAGCNPAAAEKLLTRLGKLHPVSADSISNYFSSHPVVEERIRNIKRLQKNKD